MELEGDNYEGWSSERLLAYLAESDIAQPAGFAIEVYRERFVITDDVARVLERYLLSKIVDNRSAALEALVVYGERTGYTGDALMLHYVTRDADDSNYFFSLRVLRKMADRGDSAAKRVSELLERDPFVIETRLGIEQLQSEFGYD